VEEQGVGSDQKKTDRLGAHLAFVDESGFLLIPTVRRTWAPKGKTPLLRHNYRRDRISTISALTVSARRGRVGLYVQFHRKNISGVEVLGFLRGLKRHLRGPIVVIWDGGSIHYKRFVQDYVSRTGSRLHVYRFPGYAPELNPTEYVWTNAKRYLSNGTPEDIDRLAADVKVAIRRIARSQQLLRACLRQSTLSF
jgi:transposase